MPNPPLWAAPRRITVYRQHGAAARVPVACPSLARHPPRCTVPIINHESDVSSAAKFIETQRQTHESVTMKPIAGRVKLWNRAGGNTLPRPSYAD